MTPSPPSSWREGIAGMSAGGLSTLCMHPLDLIKIRSQLGLPSPITPYSIIINHGLSALYRGLSANLVGGATSWGLYFWLYESLKRQSFRGDAGNFVAAGLAGASSMIITNPIWVVKTRMCQNIDSPYGLTDTIRAIYYNKSFYPSSKPKPIITEGSVKYFYRGIVPGLFGVIQGALQMTFYERLKKEFQPNSASGFILASAASKIMAIALSYPYQVVRSRMQADPRHTLRTILQGVIREKAYYRGILPATIRVLPSTAITFLTYETILHFFRGVS